MGKISTAVGCIVAWIKLLFTTLNFGTVVVALLLAGATGLASYLGQYFGKMFINWIKNKYFKRLPEP
jgi:hypothetical protein